MKAEDFIAFLQKMGWNDAEAMRQLGIGSRNTLIGYKENGGPLWLGLACAALDRDLPPWKDSTVKVYSIVKWDQSLGEEVILQHKRTTEGLMQIKGGIIVPGSEETVDAELIDEQGRYIPPR